MNKKQARLIYPSKTEFGLVTKNVIKQIVTKISGNSKYNLWKNSQDTIHCFKNIKNKNYTTFIQLDITDFYPSISKDLLINSIIFAKKYTNITKNELDIILACRRFISINNYNTWVKNLTDNFDVTMGLFDSSLIAELVGICILDKKKNSVAVNFLSKIDHNVI